MVIAKTEWTKKLALILETKFIIDGWAMANLQPGLKSYFKCKPKTLTALELHT